LRIEKIPPLDVFYISTHKVVIKRKRKKRNLDVTAATTPDNEPVDIFWKDSPIDPSNIFTRLSQFGGDYAISTIDKEIEVQMFLREKENKILLLEQQLEQEKSNQQGKLQIANL